jgi:hypothetical protein
MKAPAYEEAIMDASARGLSATGRERLAAGWVYLGDAAAKVPGLTRGQVGYAITMRRVLARRLTTEAGRHAIGNFSPAGKEWTWISYACRREMRRMERADFRLARAGGAK